MRVVIISATEKGGAGYASYNLYKGFEKVGVQAQFLTTALLKQLQHGWFTRLRRWWLERKHINKNFTYVQDAPAGYDYFTFPRTGYQQIHRLEMITGADVLNLHWISNMIDYPTFFKKKIDKPVIWTLHDTSAFTGGCHYTFGCKNFEVDCANCMQLSPRVNTTRAAINLEIKRKAVEGLSASRMAVVAPSIWLKQLSEKSQIFKGVRHYHIPYGVDTSVFKPYNKAEARAEFGLDARQFIVFFAVTNITERRKGFDIVLKLKQLLAHRSEVTFVAAGNDAGNKQDGISRLGFISEKSQMGKVYSAADVFLLPSRQDNLPNTMLEALCCGTPVLGFNIGGVPDAVIEGENGFLAEVEDAATMATRIEQMLDGQKVFDSEQIAADAANRYALEKQAQAYKIIMEQLLQQQAS